MFKTLMTCLLGKVILVEGSHWVVREPHRGTSCHMVTGPGPALRTSLAVVLSRWLCHPEAGTALQACWLPICPFCVSKCQELPTNVAS